MSRPGIWIPKIRTPCSSLLRDLNRNRQQTILMITHNPEAAAYADRTVSMRDGRILS